MVNKRVSELTPIRHNEVAAGDLFLLADISAIESKKLTVGDFGTYMQGVITSSFTSSHSLTASYLLYQGFPNGTASYALNAATSSFNISSSHAIWADTASHALYARSASYAITASYAISCSYAATSSVQLTYSSAFADFARTASFLLYSGIPNGTASHALYTPNATYSQTSSYLWYTGKANGTASYALSVSNAKSSSYALSSSYLTYTVGKSNGTASYALTASRALLATKATYLAKPMLHGIYTASSYTPSGSSIGIGIVSTLGIAEPTFVTAYGTYNYNFTSSMTGSVSMSISNGFTTYNIDSKRINMNLYGASEVSGTMSVPFQMVGNALSLYGNYLLYISSSSGISIENNSIKFRIDTQSDNLYII